MLKVKAVIFDMDGLMIDTEPIGQKICLTVNEKYGYHLDTEMMLNLIGTNRQSAKAYLESIFGTDYPYEMISKENAKRKREYYQTHDLIIKPGLKELLTYLRQQGIKMAVASSTAKKQVEANLKNINVTQYFDYLVGGDDIINGKPAPDIFLKALELLNIEPQEAVVLEDSKNGILAASQAGIPVICIPDLVQHDLEIQKLTYVTLDNLTQVKAYVEKL